MINKIADTLVSAGLLGKELVLTQSDNIELRDFMSVSGGEQLEILNANEQLIVAAEALVANAPQVATQAQYPTAA